MNLSRTFLLVGLILISGVNMAQENGAQQSEEAKKLQEQIDLLKKQTEVAKEELARLQAEKALSDARQVREKTPEEIAAEQVDAQRKAAEAQKAIAEAEAAVFTQQKAAAEARKSAAEADAAEIASKFGSVTGTTLTGSVDLKTGAGTGEAALLAANAVGTAVEKIVEDISSRPSAGKRYIIFAGEQRPSFGNWRAFAVEKDVVRLSFENAVFLDKQARDAGKTIDAAVVPADGRAAAVESVAAVTTGVGAALDVASKLGSYFQSDYEVGSVQIAGIDDDFFAVALAKELEGAMYPARSARPMGNDSPITDLLKELIQKRAESVTAELQLKDLKAQFQKRAEKEKDARKKAQLSSVVSALTAATAAHQTAQKSFDDLVGRLAKADDKGVTFASKVVSEKFIADALDAGDYVLFVRVNSTPGAYYTRKNLWTFFGGMPYRVMGGVIVSYMTVNGANGEIVKSGYQTVHGGYKKISEVEEAAN